MSVLQSQGGLFLMNIDDRDNGPGKDKPEGDLPRDSSRANGACSWRTTYCSSCAGIDENISTRSTSEVRFVILCAPSGPSREADEVAGREHVLAVGVAQRRRAASTSSHSSSDALVVVRAHALAGVEARRPCRRALGAVVQARAGPSARAVARRIRLVRPRPRPRTTLTGPLIRPTSSRPVSHAVVAASGRARDLAAVRVLDRLGRCCRREEQHRAGPAELVGAVGAGREADDSPSAALLALRVRSVGVP